MYRDDNNAMALQLAELSKEVEAGQAMRSEILELRRQLSLQPNGNPYTNWAALGPGEKAALSHHTLERFPVWAVGLLHMLTFGLSSIILFGLHQGKLPRAMHNDPTTAQSIGFQFIPFFNYYWMFFSPLRLADRVTLQYRLRGSATSAPRELVMASACLGVVPYINILSFLILWPIASCMMQHRINQLVDMDASRGALPPSTDPA